MHFRFNSKVSMFIFIKYIYKNMGLMVAILDFTMAARDTKLKMCPVQLMTSKINVKTLTSCCVIII